MKISPSLDTFRELSRLSRRVPVVGEVAWPECDLASLFAELYRDSSYAFLLESGKGPEEIARFSFLGQGNGNVCVLPGRAAAGQEPGSSCRFFDDAATLLKALTAEYCLPVAYLPHFWGGWVGFLGYEMARHFESIVLRSKPGLVLPDCCFMQVDRLLAYDHKERVLKIIVSQNQNEDPDVCYPLMLEEITAWWDKIRFSESMGNPCKAPPDTDEVEGFPLEALKSNMTRSEFTKRVKTIQHYIEEGDIYQANLAQRFETDCTGDPLELYLRLRRVNPSPFSGFLRFDDWAIASSSPERLVLSTGNRIETRPIAGTRPRGRTPQDDARLSAELLLNEKEKAEHLMLVDLERNDLGRICRYGTVEADALMFLEQYSHVTHIVSNVRGKLNPGVTLWDILKAVFPGGTITGCPKIRCMEIIDQLEPTTRGPYSGSFGYIGFTGMVDLNIIIRTIITRNQKAFFHVGAGIVADSDPEREYQETLDKAAALLQALSSEIVQPWNP